MRKFVVLFVNSDLSVHHVYILFNDGEQVTLNAIERKVDAEIENMCARIGAYKILAWSPVDEFSY